MANERHPKQVVNEAKLPGKVIKRFSPYDGMMLFEDGTFMYLAVEGGYDGDPGDVVIETYCPDDYILVEAGLMTEDEKHERFVARQQRDQQARDERDRKEFERLAAKFRSELPNA